MKFILATEKGGGEVQEKLARERGGIPLASIKTTVHPFDNKTDVAKKVEWGKFPPLALSSVVP